MTITTSLPTERTLVSEAFSRTIPFFMEKHYWGEHRKASMTNVEVRKDDPEQADADKQLLHLRKRLLNSERTRQIRHHDTKFREAVADLSATPFRPGLYLIPVGLVERVYTEAEAWERERAHLVDLAAEEYPTLIEPMRQRLGPLFNEFDYPTVEKFRSCFWVVWRFVNMGVPDVLRAVRADVFQREREKLEAEARQASDMVKQHLRATLLDISQHLSELLRPKGNGKMPALREGSLDRLFDFLNTVEARDVTRDGDLRAIVQRVRAGIDGRVTDPQSLRDDDALRASTAALMEQARADLTLLVEPDRPRAIRLREEVA